MLTPEPGTVRFGTYNLFGLRRHAQVISVIRELEPDVMAIQELPGGSESEASAALRRLAADTGLHCVVGGETALCLGGHGCHLGLMWRSGIDPVPGSMRRWGGGDFWHGLVLLTLDVGGTLVRHASFHATPFGRVLRGDQNERLCGLLRSSGTEPLLVGGDWNTECADRLDGGTPYEPCDPFGAVTWFDELVHQCVWTYDSSGARLHQADRGPGDVLWAGGLYDAAALLRAPWSATAGHHPDDVYGARGVRRRIDAVHVTAEAGAALSAHHVLDGDAAREASDHLPVTVDYAPSRLFR